MKFTTVILALYDMCAYFACEKDRIRIYAPARKLDTATIEQLAKCHWTDEGKNLLITGMTSNGKSYLANVLCIAAIHQFKTV